MDASFINLKMVPENFRCKHKFTGIKEAFIVFAENSKKFIQNK